MDLDQYILAWSRAQFLEELNSDFRRSHQFDGARSKERLEILLARDRWELEVLAHILPLGFFSSDTGAEAPKGLLTSTENAVFKKYQADYQKVCRENSFKRVERVRRMMSSKSKEFRASCSVGNKVVDAIAKEWQWERLGAAAGEWGLSTINGDLRFTISLVLNRAMDLFYSVSVFDVTRSRWMRNEDDFLSVLGIGGGDWSVGNPDLISFKLRDAANFAKWHAQEYTRLVAETDSSLLSGY